MEAEAPPYEAIELQLSGASVRTIAPAPWTGYRGATRGGGGCRAAAEGSEDGSGHRHQEGQRGGLARRRHDLCSRFDHRVRRARISVSAVQYPIRLHAVDVADR